MLAIRTQEFKKSDLRVVHALEKEKRIKNQRYHPTTLNV